MNSTIDTMENTEAAPQRKHVESTVNAEFDKSRPPAPGAFGRLQLRHGLLLCIALMLAWLVFSVLSSLNEIDAELEMIRANLLLSL